MKYISLEARYEGDAKRRDPVILLTRNVAILLDEI